MDSFFLSLDQAEQLEKYNLKLSNIIAYWVKVKNCKSYLKYDNYYIKNDITIPTLNIQNILDLLPKEIILNNNKFNLIITTNQNNFIVGYNNESNKLILYKNQNLLNILYQLLLFCLKNKYI